MERNKGCAFCRYYIKMKCMTTQINPIDKCELHENKKEKK